MTEVSEVLDIPEIDASEGSGQPVGPNRCSVVLFRDCSDLDKINNWENSNWILIWAEPRDVGGIVELNFRHKRLQQQLKDQGVMIDRVIIDLQAGGFPPLYPQQYIDEVRRIADLYVEFLRTTFADVKSFYFI